MKRRFRTPTPAFVVSLLALFVALGGTTYAATSLPKNSVGTAQLKKGAVTKAKINNKTVAALKGQRGATGPPGAAGVKGVPGVQGVKGDTGAQGLPGTARAYALVAANGTLVAGHSHNIVSVTHSLGNYCVELAPSISNASTGAIVSPDYQRDLTTGQETTDVEFDETCGTNGLLVRTFNVEDSPTLLVVPTDEGFFIAVP